MQKAESRMQMQIEVTDRWDALRLLNAFRDRGSFLIERWGHYEIFVRSNESEVAERIEKLLPNLTSESLTARVIGNAEGFHELAAAR